MKRSKTILIISAFLVVNMLMCTCSWAGASILVKQGGLSAVYQPGQIYNVYKRNGTVDSRDDDLHELALDWVFYRNRIIKYSKSGDRQKAAKARQDFNDVNNWLSAYNSNDVSFMIKVAEDERSRK